MRYATYLIIFLMLNAWGGFGYWSSAAITIWIVYAWNLLERSNEQIAFKEFILTLYGLNYLFSPAFIYLLNPTGTYRMKLPEGEYFMLAIPCIFLLQLGMNCWKTGIFKVSFETVKLQSILNQQVLVSWLYAGVALKFLNPFFPSDLAFFFYLLSGIRFAAAYGLFVLDARRYKWHLIGLLVLELSGSLGQGMFHDFVMWAAFFGLFWVFYKKPSMNFKLAMGVVVLLCVYILQITKSDYRAQIGQSGGEGGLASFQDAVAKNVENETSLFGTSKIAASLTRVNQAWIFASAAHRMNHIQDYQGLEVVGKYAEAAFLPRFIAPDKMMAGDRQIFNRFSGHYVTSSTSMGLGFFADGYIAYGKIGAYVFAWILGLIFCLIFKTVEYWSKVSPFFVFLLFPILNFAVRPDCETQTVMGHIVKGLFVFGGLMWYYSEYFSRRVSEVRLEVEKVEARQRLWKKSKAVKNQYDVVD